MEEPRNAASDELRRVLLLWRDRTLIENELPSKLAPCFLRHDRRHMVSMPSADAGEWVIQLLALSDVMGGQMQASVQEVLAVRGERQCAAYALIAGAGGDELGFAGVVQMDEDINQIELVVLYDPEDAAAAIVELDRLHEQLTHE